MSDVLSRTTKELRKSVNTPDFDPVDWIINPELSAVNGEPVKYWITQAFPDDNVTLSSPAQQTIIDAAEATVLQNNRRADAIALNTLVDSRGIHVRELFEVFNKRDNYLVNRIDQLQKALDAMKVSTGGVANLRDAIPATWLPTNTRDRSTAIQDYEDDINAGGAD